MRRARCLAREPLLRERFLDDVLRRDARVVVPGLPQRVEAAHAVPADQHVLQRAVQRVADVQPAGDVRRRHADHERSLVARAGAGRVQALGLPRLLPACLDATGWYRGSIARESREVSSRRSSATRCGAAGLPGTGGSLSSRGASHEGSAGPGFKGPPGAVDTGSISSDRGALESKIIKRFLPFAAVGLIAVLATAIPPQPEDWTYVWIAAVLTSAIAATGILVRGRDCRGGPTSFLRSPTSSSSPCCARPTTAPCPATHLSPCSPWSGSP